MLEIGWNANKGWEKPVISPLHDLQIHPGAKVLHYAIEVICYFKRFSDFNLNGHLKFIKFNL